MAQYITNQFPACTLTNILEEEDLALMGEQYTDMDFLSLENSRVNSFFISCLITYTFTHTFSKS